MLGSKNLFSDYWREHQKPRGRHFYKPCSPFLGSQAAIIAGGEQMPPGPLFGTQLNHPLRGAMKKNYQTLDIVQTWGGVSGAAKPLIKKRYGHVLRGEGSQRASSKVVFYKKVCILDLWTFFLIDVHASEHMNFNITYKPKIYQKNSTFWFISLCNFWRREHLKQIPSVVVTFV